MARRSRRSRRSRVTSSRTERYETDPQTGRRTRLRPRRWEGAQVNEDLVPTPIFPPRDTPWVDEDECSVCGEQYRTTDLDVSWGEGEALIRQTNRRGLVAGSSGGFRSRGPVLWAMRVLKLTRWYDRHLGCGDYQGLGYPRAVVWACRFGDDCSAVEALEACENAGLPEIPPYDPDDPDAVPF